VTPAEMKAAALKGKQKKILTKKQIKNYYLKKKGIYYIFFLGRLRSRPFLPRLQNAILPVRIIKLKKRLIKNKTKMCDNAKKIRPKYANKIKYQINI